MHQEIINSLASDWPITVCFTLLGAITLMVSTYLLKLKLRLKEQNERVILLQKDVAMLTSSASGMGQRLMLLQEKLDSLAQKTNERSDSESQLAYARALRLLDLGADDAVIADNSGLSQSEVKLMQLVNRQRNSA